MRIKVEQFCSLATSPVWQAWLFEYNKEIYSDFMQRLSKSRNCTENRNIMKEILDVIANKGGTTLLLSFLSQKFPHILHDSDPKRDKHGVFPEYVPGLLTYPRRLIFKGSQSALKETIDKFVANKPHHDSIVIDDVAYVEYLEPNEAGMLADIPEESWLIRAYRNNL